MTDRLPFDPGRLAARPALAPSAPAESPDRPLRVAELAARIDASLRAGLPAKLTVVGEISGLVERTHLYFNLKDAEAVVACVMFASAARRLPFLPENGQEVVISGRVEFYARGGKVSFIVERLEPVGAGALDLAFRKLCEELRALGWFDPERKRPLPYFPRRIAVVTSATGAALQDVKDTVRRRCPAVDLLVIDVRVQGERAACEVCDAVRLLGRNHRTLGLDAILITRGGGSKEDLWSFNDRSMAEAIVKCPIPVVAAIGHETDITIAELVADERCATPTQAAMRLTPDRRELTREVGAAHARLRNAVDRLLRLERERLRSASRHPVFRDPAWMLHRARASLADAAHRLAAASRDSLRDAQRRVEVATVRVERIRPTVRLAAARGRLLHAGSRLHGLMSARVRESRIRLDGLDRQLGAVGPRAVLSRGYSWTEREDGRLVRSVQDVRPGERVRTQLADGQVTSIVEAGGAGPRPEPRRETPDGATSRPKHPPRPPQPGLFGE